MLVVIWLLVTSHHLVPGWSLAGLWLVSGWSYLRTDFHNVCQSVSPGVTGCDIEHNKQKTVITTTTTTCHPQAVAEMSRKLWGREASCLCLRTREKLRAWELQCCLDVSLLPGTDCWPTRTSRESRGDRRRNGAPQLASFGLQPSLLYSDFLWFWHLNQQALNKYRDIKCYRMKEFLSYKA